MKRNVLGPRLSSAGYLSLLQTLRYGLATALAVIGLWQPTTLFGQTFTQSAALPGVWASTTIWGDVDSDGDPDLVVTGLTGPPDDCAPLTKLYLNAGGTLSASSDTFVDVHHGEAAFGDLDGDGDLDLVVSGATDSGTGTTRLYLNDGGSFTEDFSQSDLLGENARYSAVAWGDADRDGDLDLVSTGITTAGNPRTVLFKNGRIDENRIGSPLGGAPVLEIDRANSDRLINLYGGCVAFGDLEGDGDLDLALTGYGTDGSRQAVLYRNEPLGTLIQDTRNEDLIPLSGGDLAWADFDNDGDQDLAVSGWNREWEATTTLFINAAGILREPRLLYSGRRVIGALAWADFDNDGDSDLAVSGHTNTSERATYIAQNDDLRKLTEGFAQDFTGLRGGDVAWADIDDDGRLDLAVAGEDAAGTRSVILYTNTGVTQTNTSPTEPDNPGRPVVTSGGITLNWNDGQDEESGSAALSYALRIGTAEGANDILSATLPITFGNVGNAKTVQFAIPLARGTYFWAVRTIDGGFRESGESQEELFRVQDLVDSDQNLRPLKRSQTAWADYDNDGDPDLLLSGLDIDLRAQSLLYRNDSGQLVENADITLQGVIDGDAAWGDFDNDGDVDLVLIGSDFAGNRFTHLYRNNISTFALNVANVQVFPQMSFGSAAFGDADNDGDLDLGLMGQEPGARRAIVFLNEEGSFSASSDSLGGTDNGDLAWGDFDNDGDLDLAVTGQQPTAALAAIDLYRNEPTGKLIPDTRSALPPLLASAIAWGDSDADGDLDLAATGVDVTDGSFIAEIFQNDGTGQLSGVGAALTGLAAGGISWGDYDNDGDLDLALNGLSDNPDLLLYKNDNGLYNEQSLDALVGASFASVSWADISGNGALDLASTGQTTTDGTNFFPVTRVNDNLASRFNPNTPPSPPHGLAATGIGSTADLSWLPSSDRGTTPTPDQALSYVVRVGSTPGGHEVRSGANPLQFGPVRSSSLALSNLTSGTYFWAVRSVDFGLAASEESEEQSFIVDTVQPIIDSLQVRPRILAEGRRASVVLSFDDEPAGMDNTVSPQVTLQLTGVDQPLTVTQISYSGDLWVGEAEITEDTPGGTVIVRVDSGVDLKGNVMDPFESVIPALIATGQGGVVQSPDAIAVLLLPPNVLPSTLSENPNVQIEATLLDTPPTGASQTSDTIYEITSDPVFTLRKPATFSVMVPDGVSADRVSIFLRTGGAWTRVGGTEVDGRILTAISEFGTYGLFDDGGGAGGGAAIANLEFSNRAFAPIQGGGGSAHQGPGSPRPRIPGLVTTTDLSFDLGTSSTVRVEIYDRGGRLRRVLEPGRSMNGGRNVIRWDGRDDRNELVASGLYIFVISAGGEQAEKTVAVVNR